MATAKKASGKRKMARKSAKKRVTARKASARKAPARKSAKRPARAARVKRVAREVVQQAQVAVAAGVETLKDLGENLMERVRTA